MREAKPGHGDPPPIPFPGPAYTRPGRGWKATAYAALAAGGLRLRTTALCVCQKKQKTPGGAVRLLPDAPPSFATPCHVVVGVADAVTVGREGNLNARVGLRFVSGGPAPMAIFSQPGPSSEQRVHLGPTRHAAIMGRTAGPRSSTYARP